MSERFARYRFEDLEVWRIAISKSSALECVACIKIALQQEFISQADTGIVEKLLEQEYFKLIALGKSMGA